MASSCLKAAKLLCFCYILNFTCHIQNEICLVYKTKPLQTVRMNEKFHKLDRNFIKLMMVIRSYITISLLQINAFDIGEK